MRILVSGASGLVGSALLPALASQGHDIGRFVRPPTTPGSRDISWDPSRGAFDTVRLRGVDVIVHLAGENIAAGRWTRARKENIRRSRVDGTLLLTRALAAAESPPRVLIAASAVGYYGDRGDETLTEKSERGRGFLPAVCVAWESATEPAEAKGIRVVHLRFGVILSRHGGALKKMLLPFRLGLGGIIGNGRQYMPWISIDDAVGVILHVMKNGEMRGPVNVVAPETVTNRQFTKELGRTLGRPTIFPMPAFAARLAFGEMADALLLASTRVEPGVLRSSGYRFLHSGLEEALTHILGR
ncbi:MAG: TIGR01777 family oxidoreductase [Acidobacteria bacterium]|nr:TIGR01777 family oxidoreductase [Acidobacteriota bacterium]